MVISFHNLETLLDAAAVDLLYENGKCG